MKARDALRGAEQAFQQTPLPAEALSRLRRRVLAGPSRRPWLVLAAAAASALAAFAFWPRAASVEDVRLAAAERYTHGRFELTANAASLIHRNHDELTLRSGEVTVSVEKHPERVRLHVSHGFIEVVGTRFTVRQRDDGGEVTLHEGLIHFVAPGETHVLAPGETYAWPPRAVEPQQPPPAVPEPEVAPPAPLKKPKAHVTRKEPAVIHETDAAWLLEEVDTCRSRGEYREAVRLLDKGLDGIVSATTRERFSYELGSILTWQLGDERACKHWASHLAAFPSGRYMREIDGAMERAKCAPR